MLSCAGADRLQTGMRGAYGKPSGTAARVRIGQVLLSVRAKEQHGPAVLEALRRAKFKFAGRQLICTSRNWGFTNVRKTEFQDKLTDGSIKLDGVNVKAMRAHGPLKPLKYKQTQSR